MKIKLSKNNDHAGVLLRIKLLLLLIYSSFFQILQAMTLQHNNYSEQKM